MNGPDLLKRWRTDRGISQSAAGELVDVHQNTWSDWESGKKTPQTTTALRLHVLTEGRCPIEAWSEDEATAAKYRLTVGKSPDSDQPSETVIVREGFDQTEAA